MEELHKRLVTVKQKPHQPWLYLAVDVRVEMEKDLYAMVEHGQKPPLSWRCLGVDT